MYAVIYLDLSEMLFLEVKTPITEGIQATEGTPVGVGGCCQ